MVTQSQIFKKANELIREGYERKQAFAIAYSEMGEPKRVRENPAPKRNPTNYQSAIRRVKEANTVDGLYKLQKSFDRVYNAGHLTVSELKRLDTKIIEKLADFEMKQNPAPKRKTAARTQRAAESYVYRDSQVTKKKPTKRLVTRRAKNLQAPRGVFPNPKKRDPTYWVITLHDGYLSYRSDSGYTGSEPYSILDGNTERQKAMSFIRKIGIKRGQYEILKDNPDVHFDIDVNSHNARGSKAKTRVNPATRKKEIIVEYELSGHNFAKRNRGMYGWKELAKFPDTPEGSENAIQYAQAYHKIAPHLRIQVVTK